MKRSKHEKKLRWLEENQTELEATYPGMWVAIGDAGLAGVGRTLIESEQKAAGKGVTDVVLTGVKKLDYQDVRLIR